MNNNRGNNRRRGRGNNRQSGGGQQLNRIDSRARGNAPQLLEKYRKLAHDAHLNGDRVQEEYYLQFADHYFRVIADARVRPEEQRQQRPERWQEGGDGYREDGYRDGNEGGEESADDGEYAAYPQPSPPRREREPRPRREEAAVQPSRKAEVAEEPAGDEATAEAPAGEDRGNEAAGEPVGFEPAENPFVRDNRGTRGLRPRRNPRPAQDEREDRPRREPRVARDEADDSAPAQLDPASLPPAIKAAPEAASEAAEDAPKLRRRAPRRKPSDEAGEALESVG